MIQKNPLLAEDQVVEIGGIGVITISKADLLQLKTTGRKADVMVVGMLSVPKDIDLELVEDTIRNVRIYGTTIASSKVKLFFEERNRKEK